MAKNEAKIKFTAETAPFNDAIKKSSNELSQLKAELKLNEAQMQRTGATVEGLENKHRILSAQLSASESKTEALNQKIQKAVDIYGDNSAEVTKLRTQLANAQVAEEKIRAAIDRCNSELDEQKKAMQDVGQAAETMSDKVKRQENELSDLKRAYADLVAESGDASDEAQALAKKITDLSTDLKANKKAMDDAEQAADDLDQSLDDVGEGAEQASEGFTVMKGAMADLVADGIEKVAEGLGNVAKESFEMANDIDSATNTFIAKTGESADSAGEFEDAMVDIYNGNYGESFEDISESMATIKTAMGDIGTDELENLTQKALILRDTFDMDVNESIRGVNSMMDQFGISGDEAYNLIAQGAQKGLNQNGDLLDVVNEYSVQFANAGFSAEDMFNMLANGAEEGTWSVDKLGDAVKEYNIRVSDGTVAEALEDNRKKLGLTETEVKKLTSAYGKGGDAGREAMQKTLDAVLSVEDETERYKLGVQLFGTMWEDLGEEAVTALFSTKGEISTTKDALGEINAIKYDDLGSALEGIKRNLQTSVAEPIKENVMPAVNEFIEDVDWQSVGQTIGEAFGAIVEGALAIGEAIAGAVGWMREHQVLVGTIAAAVGVLTVAIGAYNVVQAVKSAMDAAQVTTIWALVAAHWAQATAAMAAIAPYVLVVAAIAAVIAIIVLCVKYWDEIVAAVKNCWEAIKATLSTWGEWINTNVIQPVKQFFSDLWSGIKETASTLWEGVKTVFASFVSWINTNVVQPVVNFFTGMWDAIKSIWDGICNVVQVAIMLIGSIISAAVQIITVPFRFIWENCKGVVTSAWNAIKSGITTAINAVKRVITTVMNAIKNTFTTVWNSVKSVVTSVWNAIVNFITPILNKIKSAITKAWNAVKSTISSVMNTVKSNITTAWNAVKSVVTTVVNAVKSAVSTAFNAVKSTVTSIFNGIKSTATSVWNGIKNAISTAVNAVKSKVTSIFNSVKSTVTSVFNGIKSTATSVWNGIKNAITKPIEAAKNKVKSVVDSIKGFFKGMKLSLPKIKLPHFKVTGKLSLDPPSVPKLSIDWYKDGGIMMNPTIFGMNGSSLMAGGEAGPEAILPIEKLEGYIADVVDKTMNVVNLGALADSIEELANRPINFYIGDRQIAMATAGASDNVNGLRTLLKDRGLIL